MYLGVFNEQCEEGEELTRVCMGSDMEGRYWLYAKGHACFAKEGRDILCSAISMLCHTFCVAMKQMEEAGEAEIIEQRMRSADVALCMKKSTRKASSQVFDTVLALMNMLCVQYPQHIKMSEIARDDRKGNGVQ